MDIKLFVTFTVLLAGVTCQISNDLDIDPDEVKNKLGEEFPDLDTSQLDPSKLPQIDELDLIFRNKCDNKSGNGTYDKVKGSKDVFQECVSNFVNATQLREEVEEAKKTGSMDEVFGKYCNKYPELSKCRNDFIEAMTPCMEEKESKSLNISIGLMDKMKDFICHKNGDRIAMFVAEGGIDCIKSQKDAIQQCLNTTFGSRVPADMSPNSFPVLQFNGEDCSDFSKFRTCIAEALGNCEETTPANLMDALFKYLKKILPCSESADSNSLKADGNSSPSITPVTFLTLISCVLLVKYV
ncbi:hypothetical protein WA026_022562 [Henosepilachna vigintioctopunctata]|uniref:27 kDa hemolymph protein n=1 Tax=Henosepilachna vigintioctopunctata TaxID=420089 RepID=A0AAW1VI14_9CUCU